MSDVDHFFMGPGGRARPVSPDLFKEPPMHYRNGREAKNGDVIVQLEQGGRISDIGTLCDAVAGNDYCNGEIRTMRVPLGNKTLSLTVGACLADCLHVDDVAAMLTEKGLNKRPPGK